MLLLAARRQPVVDLRFGVTLEVVSKPRWHEFHRELLTLTNHVSMDALRLRRGPFIGVAVAAWRVARGPDRQGPLGGALEIRSPLRIATFRRPETAGARSFTATELCRNAVVVKGRDCVHRVHSARRRYNQMTYEVVVAGATHFTLNAKSVRRRWLSAFSSAG
jgi:hypothetical protein